MTRPSGKDELCSEIKAVEGVHGTKNLSMIEPKLRNCGRSNGGGLKGEVGIQEEINATRRGRDLLLLRPDEVSDMSQSI